MYCRKCPAHYHDDEGGYCQIGEEERELNKSSNYGCSRRSVKKIEADLEKYFEEEGKAWEEFVMNR